MPDADKTTDDGYCPRCGHLFADQAAPCRRDPLCPHPGVRADAPTIDIAKTRQAAWAYACCQYAATYDHDDPQHALWMRRAERPKEDACNVR